MDPNLKLILKSTNQSDREKVRLNKRLFTYLFFLIISIIFWYLIALSKTYIAETHYAVFYKNFPKGKILVSELPVKLNFKVRGYGFQILRYKIISLFKPVNINLNDFKSDIKQNVNSTDYYLLTRLMQEKLNARFNELQLIGIKPDTLFFNFTDVIDKKVPVKPNLELNFKKQFMLNGAVRVLPDCLEISGPKVYIDTLSYIYTEKTKIDNINDTVIYPLKLIPLKSFIYPATKVKVFIPCEKFTEIVFSIPIETINVPEGYELKTFPGSVTVNCMVSLSNYDKITPFMFKAQIDYNSILDKRLSKLRVNMVKYPLVIHNLKIYPKSVEYILEK